MAKKKDDTDTLLIGGGLLVVGYLLFFKKKPLNSPIQSIVPVNNAMATPANNTSSIVSAGASLFKSITDLISPSQRGAPLTVTEDINLDFDDNAGSTAQLPQSSLNQGEYASVLDDPNSPNNSYLT